jgi:hypothetical protein
MAIGLLVFPVLALFFQLDGMRLIRLNYPKFTPLSALGQACRAKVAQSPRSEVYQAGQKLAYAEEDDADPGPRDTRQQLLNYALSPAVVNASVRSPRVLVFHADPARAERYAEKHGLTLLDRLDEHVRVYEKKD